MPSFKVVDIHTILLSFLSMLKGGGLGVQVEGKPTLQQFRDEVHHFLGGHHSSGS